jgi:hypothetical protein
VPTFALVHEKLHSGGPLVRFASSASFFLEIVEYPLIHGAPKTVERIDTFYGLDYSGPAPNALVIDH